MTKTKMSTVVIVTLSVLLAAALAATIVFATFAFTGKASTTITFGSGVTVEVTGITGETWNTYLVSNTGVISSEAYKGNTDGLTQGIALAPISIQNTSNSDIYVAVGYLIENVSEQVTAPTLYVTSTSGTSAANETTEMTGAGAFTDAAVAEGVTVTDAQIQWKVFELAKGADGATPAAVNVVQYINSGYSAGKLESAKGFKATLYIAAVVKDSQSNANLNSVITTAGYATASA